MLDRPSWYLPADELLEHAQRVASATPRNDRADVAEKSPEVAEKSPPQECSICRGTHGMEVQHACE